MVRQSLLEVHPADFLDLVDGGEGNEEAQGPRKMSSTPLRMCRYAGGADGVAFGERPRRSHCCDEGVSTIFCVVYMGGAIDTGMSHWM